MTFFELVQKYYPKVAEAFKPKPAEPVALQMLHDFKGFAAKIDAFNKQPNDGAKYLYLRDNGPFPTDEFMGVTPGWKNAVMYEGELNNTPVSSFRGDPAQADFSWALGSPPPNYVAPTPVDGRTALKAYLTQAAKDSPFLRGLGLTPEAIAAA